MKNRLWGAGFILAMLALGVAKRATALPRYEELSDLDSAGSITGVVRFDGKVPTTRFLKVTSKDKVCHKEPIPDESLVVSKDGKIRWAVVSIKGITRGKAIAADPITLDQKNCRFRPHVVVVPVGRTLQILNSDGILHNVHLHCRRNPQKNIAMLGSSRPLELQFRRAERIHVKCDAHPWMSAWVVTGSHPYYAVSGEDGTFRLDQVPPGEHELEAWHETLGEVVHKVTVKPGKDSRVEFVLTK